MARREFDFYPTPRYAVARFLEMIVLPQHVPWIEPCCGDGALLRHVASVGYEPASWHTNDIRDVPKPSGALTHRRGKADAYLRTWQLAEGGGVCFTNPPFNAAFEIIVAAVECCDIVAMFLPASWLGTQGRSRWLSENRPAAYYLPERPDFTRTSPDAPSRNGNQNYHWLVWGCGAPENHFLDPTPKSERIRDEIDVAGVARPMQPTLFGEEQAA